MKSDTLHELYELFLLHPHISTDSRRIEPGSIFFALHGEHFDGNRYAAAALESGAVAVVVDDPKVIPLVEVAPCSCGHLTKQNSRAKSARKKSRGETAVTSSSPTRWRHCRSWPPTTGANWA